LRWRSFDSILWKTKVMSLFCPTCGSAFKDIRAPVIVSISTQICCDNWHWIGKSYQNAEVLTLSAYDRDLLHGMNIRVDD
jgi:hypothetical protein